jgi:hypothetical protein
MHGTAVLFGRTMVLSAAKGLVLKIKKNSVKFEICFKNKKNRGGQV